MMTIKTCGVILVVALSTSALGAQTMRVSKARPVTSAEEPEARSSRIPEIAVAFQDRADARRLGLADLATPARAVRGPKFPETEVHVREAAVGGANADAHTGNVWLVLLSDGLGPREYGYAGFKSPALSHEGQQALESVSVAATGNVREFTKARGSQLTLTVRVYADGAHLRSGSQIIDSRGEMTCTVSGLRLEPGVTYHAVAAFAANAGDAPGALVAAEDAEIVTIRWSF